MTMIIIGSGRNIFARARAQGGTIVQRRGKLYVILKKGKSIRKYCKGS